MFQSTMKRPNKSLGTMKKTNGCLQTFLCESFDINKDFCLILVFKNVKYQLFDEMRKIVNN